MADKQTENVAEAIQMIQAIKQHLQEEACTHSLATIVKEALEVKGLRSTTTPDVDTTNSGTNRNGREYSR